MMIRQHTLYIFIRIYKKVSKCSLRKILEILWFYLVHEVKFNKLFEIVKMFTFRCIYDGRYQPLYYTD